jgi:putative cardiolipin synthase
MMNLNKSGTILTSSKWKTSVHRKIAFIKKYRERGRPSPLALCVIVFAIAVTACSSQPVVYPKTESRALTNTDTTSFGEMSARFAQSSTEDSGVYPLYIGLDAFDARSALIENAEASIDIQVFLYHDGVAGGLLGKRILDAADRGVRVRLLLDDFHTQEVAPAMVAATQHPNIEVRFFNPFSRDSGRTAEMIGNFSRLNRRMHNKSFTADNQVAIVGGRNIGDEYYEASAEVAFLDSDLLCVGQIVSQVSSTFDRYWNSSQAIPAEAFEGKLEFMSLEAVYEEGRRVSEASKNTSFGQSRDTRIVSDLLTGEREWVGAPVELLFDDPEPDQDPDHGMVMAPMLASLQNAATQDILILSPYFVPQQPMVDLIANRIQNGVRVRIVTNSLASTNQTAVHAGYKRYRKALLAAGAEIFELVSWADLTDFPGSDEIVNTTLHSKVMVVDTSRLFVGSFNLDPRSAKINTEMGLLVSSPELAAEFIAGVDSVLETLTYRVTLNDKGKLAWHYTGDGKNIVKTKEPETSWWRRTNVWFLGLLPIEDQL